VLVRAVDEILSTHRIRRKQVLGGLINEYQIAA